MPETIILDPSEVATGRSELNINSGSIQVRAEGVDWGTAEIQAFMAESRRGESIVDYRVPNRQITIPLVMQTSGTATFTNARDQLSAKAAQIQAQGGWIKRVTSQGGTYFADLVNASLVSPGGWIQSHKDVENEAVLTLEALPDFYGAEATLSDHVETSAAEITFTETTSAGGDFPLGDRVRVVVDEDDADNQRGLFWSFRARHYSSASTAASAYEAEALTILDTATRVAKAGASNGSMVTHGTLSSNWTPVLSTNLQAGSYLTHTGGNRLYARVFSTSGTAVQARVVYDVGDLVYPTENPGARLYDAGTFCILDLGEVRLDPAPTGAHRWQGQIQARGDAGAESFSVDRLWIVNQDESAGLLRAPPSFSEGLVAYSARSDFTTESGAIAGDSLIQGGTWTGTGDADDFSVSAGVASRTATLDSGDVSTGRHITASGTSGMTNTAVRVSASHSLSVAASSGVLLRYTDANNFVAAYMVPPVTGNPSAVVLFKRLASSNTVIASRSACLQSCVGAYVDIGAYVLADGTYAVFGGPAGSGLAFLFGGLDSSLASGTLASGKAGIVDLYGGATANTRSYKSFACWVPTQDAVAFASQSVELNTKGMIREDSAGAAYGPVSYVSGDLPRMPNRSSAGTVEFMAKASRGDLQATPDPGIDDISARIYRSPSYLTPD